MIGRIPLPPDLRAEIVGSRIGQFVFSLDWQLDPKLSYVRIDPNREAQALAKLARGHQLVVFYARELKPVAEPQIAAIRRLIPNARFSPVVLYADPPIPPWIGPKAKLYFLDTLTLPSTQRLADLSKKGFGVIARSFVDTGGLLKTGLVEAVITVDAEAAANAVSAASKAVAVGKLAQIGLEPKVVVR